MKISIVTSFLVPIIFTLSSLFNVSESNEGEIQSNISNYTLLENKSISYVSTYSVLMDLYNDTNGANWTNNNNWGDASKAFNLWYGLSTDANGNVTSINLKNNNLSGDLPFTLDGLSSLEDLNLSQNSLFGILPNTIANITTLNAVRLNNNDFSGPIPAGFGNLNNLTYLILSNNDFNTGIPSNLGNASSLKDLALENNPNLGGTIPSSLGNFTSSDLHIYLSDCGLTGSIPSALGNLNVHLLYLDDNNLTGNIPNSFDSFTDPNLQLYLSNNDLSGCFPSGFNSYCSSSNVIISALGNPNMDEDDFGVFCTNGGSCGSAGCSLPDLTVKSMNLSSNSVQPGGSIDLSFAINNTCDGTSAGSSVQKWFLSDDDIYDASDLELGAETISNINGGQSVNVNNKTINISATQATGDYYIIVYADHLDQVSEEDEANNTEHLGISIGSNSGGGNNGGTPDLVIVDQYGSSQVAINNTIYINGKVKNNGTAKSEKSVLEWHISTTTNLSGVIHTYSIQNDIPVLSPGQSSKKYKNLTLPLNVEIDSTYFLIFEADAFDDVSESNEGNNLAHFEFTVISATYNPNTDLIPTSLLSVPNSEFAGNTFSPSVQVCNEGTNTTGTNDAKIRYFLSTDTYYQEGIDIELGQDPINELCPTNTNCSCYFLYPQPTITIPDTIPTASYHIIGFVDANDILDELDEGNNFIDRPIDIVNNIYKPNFETSVLTTPSSVDNCYSFEVGFEIISSGEIMSLSSAGGIYLSDDIHLDASDLFLKSFAIPTIGKNGIFKSTQSVNVPTSVNSGEYFIILKADRADTVIELFENDNVIYSSIVITELPDIVPTTINPNFSTLSAGDFIDVSIVVSNPNSLVANHSSVGVFLDGPITMQNQIQFLKTFDIPSIQPGANITINESVQIPNYFETGMYNLNFEFDFLDEIIECVEINNSISNGINLIHEPDLVAINPFSTDNVLPGDPIFMTIEILNQGSLNAGISKLRYYLSNDAVFDANDILLVENDISPIAPNGVVFDYDSGVIPSTTSTGAYFILFMTDFNNDVTEFDENNNTTTLPINIGGCPYETSNIYQEICDGNSYTYNSTTYSTTGIYVDTIIANGGGCDTIVTIDLTVWPVYSNVTNESICDNETYVFNGTTYDTTGTYIDSLLSVNNCDSILTLNLTVNPTYTSTINETICDGDAYTFNGINETDAGTYYDTLTTINNCDSIIILNLTVDPLETANLNENICDGEVYTFNGIDYDTIGVYTDTITSTGSSCDTIYTIDITLFPTYSETLNETICEGESYTLNGNTYNETGTYTETLATVNACDSIIILDLTVNPLNETTLFEIICEGETFNATNGNSYSATGVYLIDTVSATGSACDTIITLDLTVHPIYQDTLNENICEGDTYEFNGTSYSNSGTYTGNLTTINNCDSIVTLNLTVLNSISTNLVEEICDNETFLFNGNSYNMTTIIVDTLIGTGGDCDTIATLDLTVYPTYSDTTVAIICSNETYDFNGTSYTTSGVYIQTESSSNNCDSILVLDLTVDPLFESTLNEEICEGDSVFFNSMYYSMSGTYQDTLTNPTGCDSVVSLILTVEFLDKRTENKTLCFGDTCSFLGNEYSTSGTYEHFVNNPNSALCDSLVTLELIVLTAAESNCANYSNAGSISYPSELEVAEETFDPNLIESQSGPSGGQCGEKEFQWQLKLESVDIWEDIAGANSSEYDPITITENTCFRRNVRRDCQANWIESNEICFELEFCSNYSDGGVLDYDGPLSTVEAFLDPGIIYEDIEPSGGGGDGTNYQWQEKVADGSWLDIDGVVGIDYSPDTLMINTCFRRKVTKTCVGEWVLSNEICFEILNCQNISGPGNIIYSGMNQANLSMDPDPIMGDIPPGGNGGQVLYQWQKNHANNWEDIGGATSQNYDSPTIYQNTCFRRGATIDCNENYLYTSLVCFGINGCENYSDPGFITYEGYTGFATSIDPSLIEGTIPSGGGGGSQEYIWEEQLDFSGVWIAIPNATEQHYDPPQFTETRCFRRKARIDCQVNWQTSFDICFVNCTTEAMNNGAPREEQSNECETFLENIITETFDCCHEESPGRINISGLNEEGFEIIWNNGATTLNLDNLHPGNYCTTIVSSEIESCIYTNCFLIEEICPIEKQNVSIIINEVSNGTRSGAEYVELLVLGANDCQPMDVRGFILDDNNGAFNNSKSDAPAGFSQGHIRFSYDERLSEVFPGSIILIYNNQNKNRSISFADDPFDEDGDGIYIMPINATSLIGNSKLPSISFKDSYELSNEFQKANWENIWLFDYYDGIQIRNPDGSFHYGFSYGTELKITGGPDNLLIKDSNLKGQSIFFNGLDYLDKNDFMYATTASGETPGNPNSYANKLFINSLECEEVTTVSVSDHAHKLSFKNYPNPFIDDFILEVNSEQEIGLEILVYDLLGNNIIKDRIVIEKGRNNLPIKFNDRISSGAYYLIVRSKQEMLFNQKIIRIK